MTRIKKQVICIAAALAAATFGVSAYNFPKQNTYSAGQFQDVSESEWYAKEVANTYELGLMKGVSDTSFNPNGNITIAESITLISRIHAAFNGKTVSTEGDYGDAWYMPYVTYAESNGIMGKGEFDNYDRNAKRKEFASLLYSALPSSEYNAINEVKYIPDVAESNSCFEAVSALYKAGVIMGSDKFGTFMPESDILRCEAAAIINRVALPENRLKKTLVTDTAEDAYVLCYNTGYSNSRNADGEESGWRLDNRGGVPRSTVAEPYTGLYDISDEYGTAFIRDLNLVTRGCVTVETSVTVNGGGGYMEFSDADGETLYKVSVTDTGWKLLTANGNMADLSSEAPAKSATKYTFRIILDLDNGNGTTYINNVNCGTYPLLSDSISSFRFATEEKSILTLTPGSMQMTVNYSVYETFDNFGIDSVYGWISEGNVNVGLDKELHFDGNSKLAKSVAPISGKVVYEWYQLLPKADDFTVSLKGQNADLVKFEAANGKFVANGKEIYSFTKNMWYRLRMVLDTNTGKADIYVNGRVAGTVDATAGVAVDGIYFEMPSGTASVDDVKLYREIDHDDYVPEPTTKADLEDYIVGINVCSLWRNGYNAFGWSAITPYGENTPVLGYYDEGCAETADWEIKYMVEHGIDFQAFCWYADGLNPIKNPRNNYQLHDGYMYAKYSDYMKYVIIWETYGGAHFGSQYFREVVVPYWFENYFLDDRYLKVDNRIVLPIYAGYMLKRDDYFRSVEGARAELDYLESVARSYGYDGFLFLTNDSSTDEYAQMGYDASFAYHWGTSSHIAAENKTSILLSEKVTTMHTVPTLSVGYDCRPWLGGARTGLMPFDDYKETALWIKNDYLPKYDSGSWESKMVWISTWNEYGEGTFIMPSEGYGFNYLNSLKNAFGGNNEHEDMIPNEAQKLRINRLYPQNVTALRRTSLNQQMSEAALEEEEAEIAGQYTPNDKVCVTEKCSNVSYDNGVITATVNEKATPSVIFYCDYSRFDASDVTKISVSIKGKAGRNAKLYFATKTDPYLTAEKGYTIEIDSDEWKTYDVYTSGNSYFKGTLTVLRVDPCSCKEGETIDFGVGEITVYTRGSDSTSLLAEYSPSSEICVVEQSEDVSFKSGVLTAVATGGDPTVQFRPDYNGIRCEDISTIAVDLQGIAGKTAQLFFATKEDKFLTAEKCYTFNVDSDEMKTYYINVASNKAFKGELNLLRIDPFDGKAGSAYSVGKIRLMSSAEQEDNTIKSITVNGIAVENEIMPEDVNCIRLFPYSPETGINYMLNTFTIWDRREGTLSIEAYNHHLVYTVGKDTYTIDGVEKSLGYTMFLVDGIPMLNYKQLCDDLGYSYTENNGVLEMTTPQNALLKEYTVTSGKYDFKNFQVLGWKSSQMELTPMADSLICTSKDTNRDPQLNIVDIELQASSIKTLTIRCRYSYTAEKPSYMQLFYITNSNPNWDEEKSIRIPLNSTDSNGEWETYTVDLTTQAMWKDTVTKIRLDPFAAYGTMEYDSIIFE